jgi:lantibiotic transport system ATP-binding protein
VEQIASHIGIIHEGRLLFQGRLTELQKRQHTQLRVGTNQLDQASNFLASAGWSVERRDGMLSVAATTSEDAIKVNSLLVDRGIGVFYLALAQASLEDIFLTLTAHQSTRSLELVG